MEWLPDWRGLIGYGLGAVLVGIAVALRTDRSRIALTLIAVFVIVLAGLVVLDVMTYQD